MLLYAVIYSFVFYLICGLDNREALRLFLYDTIIIFALLGPIGFALISVVRYGSVAFKTIRLQSLFFVMVITFCLIVSLGMETLAIYLLVKTAFPLYAPTIAARAMILLSGFIATVLYVNHKITTAEVTEQKKQSEPTTKAEITIDDHISVREGQKIKIISIEEIEYLQADGDYVAIHTNDGKWLKEQTMKYYEEHLPQNRFVRIHRSYIVNINFLSRIERYGQLQCVILRNGTTIKISAAGYKLLKSRIE